MDAMCPMHATDVDECAAMRERSVAGTDAPWLACHVHHAQDADCAPFVRIAARMEATR